MNKNNFILSELIRQSQLGAGNNDIDNPDPEVPAPPVITDDNTVVIPEQLDNVPPVTVDTCALQEEVALVEAATDAINAECVLVDALVAVEAAEAVVEAEQTVLVETLELRASMEAFLGSPTTKQDAYVLQQRVMAVTNGQYDGTKLTGSLEDFGSKISSDEALNAGLEGLGEFIKGVGAKISAGRKAFVATMSNFFKEIKVTNLKVAKRAEAVKQIANRTTGDSNSSSVQLSVDTGWWLTVEGGVPKNLSKAMVDLGVLAKAVFKTAPDEILAERKKFIESLGDLVGSDLKAGLKAAEKVIAWSPSFPSYAKIKVPGNRVCEVQRSAEMLGGVAIYIGMPPEDDNKRYNLSQRLDRLYNRFTQSFVELNEVAKRPGKLDLSVDTLKPVEIVKLADDVINMLADIDTYRTDWDTWLSNNNELDRAIAVLSNVGWDGGETTSVTTNGDGVEINTSNLSVDLAASLELINEVYAYISVSPIRLLSKQVVSVLNRMLEVCELSLATYSDNSLK